MALPVCSFCGEFEAAMVFTFFSTGDTEAPCMNCAPQFILTLAESIVAAAPTQVLTDEFEQGDGELATNGPEFEQAHPDNEYDNEHDPKTNGHSLAEPSVRPKATVKRPAKKAASKPRAAASK